MGKYTCVRNSVVRNASGTMLSVSCGSCIPCVLRYQTHWILRMKLELQSHACSSFLTLTYADHERPNELYYPHLRQFLKELRRSSQHSIRYFAVAEYGARKKREHFHLILFGQQFPLGRYPIAQWRRGMVFGGEANTKTMSYVTRYVLKGRNHPSEHKVWQSRGLGMAGFHRYAEEMYKITPKISHVPMYWKHGKNSWGYIGRYGKEKFTERYLELGGQIEGDKRSKAELEWLAECETKYPIDKPDTTNYQFLRQVINGTAL